MVEWVCVCTGCFLGFCLGLVVFLLVYFCLVGFGGFCLIWVLSNQYSSTKSGFFQGHDGVLSLALCSLKPNQCL